MDDGPARYLATSPRYVEGDSSISINNFDFDYIHRQSSTVNRQSPPVLCAGQEEGSVSFPAALSAAGAILSVRNTGDQTNRPNPRQCAIPLPFLKPRS